MSSNNVEETTSTKTLKQKIGKSQFSILSQNIRSISKNINHLQSFLNEMGKSAFDVIACQEVWRIIDGCKYELIGYSKPNFKTRKCKNGGGVGVWVKKGIEYEIDEQNSLFMEGVYESIVIKVTKNHISKLIVNIYRPPNQSLDSFILQFRRQLSLLGKHKEEL